MFPLLLISIAGLGFLYGSDAGQAKVINTVGTIAPGFIDIARTNLANVVAFRGLSSIVGICALWWSSKNFFMGLRYALNRALGITKSRPYVVDVVWGLIAVPAAGALLAIASAAPIIVRILGRWYDVRRLEYTTDIISYCTAFVLVFLVTLTLYSHLPNRKVGWAFGLPGAVFCAFSWAIIQFFYVIYTKNVIYFKIYGAVSAILALMFWFYLMGLVFLYGAQLCAARLSDKLDHEQVDHEHHSRRLRRVNLNYRRDLP